MENLQFNSQEPKKDKSKILLIVLLVVVSIALGYFIGRGTSPAVSIFPEVSGRDYVSRDVGMCGIIQYTCDEGEQGFSDETGCGCEEVVVTNNDVVSDNMNGSASVTFEPTEAELEVSPAYVRSVSQDGSNYEIVVDYIQILPYQQGNPNPMGEIVNNNPMLRTFTLTPDTQFVFQTRSNDPVSGNFNYNESVDFQTATTTLAAGHHFVGNETGVPFMITVDLNTNEVVSLIEIYTS